MDYHNGDDTDQHSNIIVGGRGSHCGVDFLWGVKCEGGGGFERVRIQLIRTMDRQLVNSDDGQTIGQLTGESDDGQTIGQLTGEFGRRTDNWSTHWRIRTTDRQSNK
jgi:hypothetical protein